MSRLHGIAFNLHIVGGKLCYDVMDASYVNKTVLEWLDNSGWMKMTWPQLKLFLGSTSPLNRRKRFTFCVSRPFQTRIIVASFFSDSNKSQACVNLETLVDTKLHWGNSVTEIICRNCARTNENVVKKILEIRQQFLSSKERLAAHCGTVDSVKRRSKASLDQVVRGILKTKSFVRWKQRYCRYRRTCSIGHINREVYSNFVLARKKFWWVCRSCKWKFQTVRIARFCSWLRNHKTCVNISPKF